MTRSRGFVQVVDSKMFGKVVSFGWRPVFEDRCDTSEVVQRLSRQSPLSASNGLAVT